MENNEELKNELGVHLNQISLEELENAITTHDSAKLKAIFDEIPTIDIAELADELDNQKLITLFRDIDSTNAAELFDDLSKSKKEELIQAMTDKDLIKIINEGEPDELADTVGDMPANLASRVLKAADPSLRGEINQLLKFKPESAGALMTTKFLELKESLTVEEAIKEIRAQGKKAETIYTIFLRNDKRKFVGTVDLDDLVFADPKEKLKDLANKDTVSVHVKTDQEEVANLIRRYDLNAIAVLNDDDCLVGIITVDDAVDILTKESTEDIEHMNAVGTLDDTYLETHPFQMAKKCIPWLVILLILGTLSSLILSNFQEKISVLPVLAAFIPVLMDTGGNAGGQTTALIVRGLALKEFKPRDTGKIIFQEIRSALIIGSVVAVFALIWFTFEQYVGIVHNPQADPEGVEWATIWNGQCWTLDFFLETLKVSSIVAGTLFCTIIVSKIIAAALPLGVAALKKDPAVVSQPLLTTIVDMASLLIYFAIAEVLVLQFL